MKRVLVDSVIKSAKPKSDKASWKLTDGGGLHLLVKDGGKYWRYNYRFQKKYKTLALGIYPNVGLKKARELHDIAREQIQNGIDPASKKKIQKLLNQTHTQNTFESIAREWYAEFKHTWVESHSKRLLARLENDIFPVIGDRAIEDIEPPEILSIMRVIHSRGALESAHRARIICGQVFRYAVATGRASRDKTTDLKGALPQPAKNHFAALTSPAQIRRLLIATDNFQGTFVVKSALQISPLVMLRPGELRKGLWSEIDFDKKQWEIPISRMKARKATKLENESSHIVPLSRQALEILKQLHPYTKKSDFIFPSARSLTRPMSENAVLYALRSMGFTAEEMTAHGFRASASTLLHEMGFKTEVIELQLAHKDKNSVRASYNHALYLKDRIKMLQKWADYLEELKNEETDKTVDK